MDDISDFFDYMEKGAAPHYTFEEDKHAIAVVDEIEGTSIAELNANAQRG